MASFFSRGGGSGNEPSSPAPKPSPAPPRPVQREPKRPEPAAGGRTDATHVASGSKVVGEVTGDAELVIDGVVQGEIRLDSKLVVGEKGRVEGKILAASVEVAGKVQGNVAGRDRVEVLASGSLEGDVVAPRVVIAEGAFFKGKVEMADPPEAARARDSKATDTKRGGEPKSERGGGKPRSDDEKSQGARPEAGSAASGAAEPAGTNKGPSGLGPGGPGGPAKSKPASQGRAQR